jgi:hypothetical protein
VDTLGGKDAIDVVLSVELIDRPVEHAAALADHGDLP